jgi:hypothetical protein
MNRRRAALALAAFGIAAFGAWLRLWSIGAQIVSDDEMHSLNAVRWDSAWQIFTTWYPSDVGNPFALLQDAIGTAVGLNEVTARLPVLAAGLGAVVVLPWLARSALGTRVALTYAALIAVSPQLVYYSRYGRPYMVSTFLAACALFALLRWWRHGEPGAAAAYAVIAPLAIWFSLPVAPVVATPLGVAAVAVLMGRAPCRSRAPIAALTVGLVLGTALLLAPASIGSPGGLVTKIGGGRAGPGVLGPVAGLYAGTSHVPLMLAFWVAAAIGVAVGCARHRAIFAAGAAAIAAAIAGLWITNPVFLESPLVFARYAAGTLPIVLLCVAFGLAEIDRRLNLGPITSVGCVFALLAWGPFPKLYRSPNQFTNHTATQRWFDLPDAPPPPQMSPFYCGVGRRPEPFAIVETPWFYYWSANLFGRYQQVHHRTVYIGMAHPDDPNLERATPRWPFGGPFRFRHFVPLDAKSFGAPANIRYAVVHKDLYREMGQYLFFPEPGFPVPEMLRDLSGRFGAPVFEDDRVVVFRVDGVREPTWSANDTRCP